MYTLEFRFAFYAKIFERSVSFYRDTLGMALKGGWDRPDGIPVHIYCELH